MRKINIVVALLIMLTVSFNLISLRVLSQTSSDSVLDTYTISLTNKDGKTSLNSPTTALNITVLPGGQNVAGIESSVSLKATGVITVLTNVDATKNLITVVWSGGISDGKATVTGMLKQGTTIAPDFTVVKVEKDGGANITNDLNITVNLSSSTTGSSSSSSGGTTTSSSSGGTTASSSSGGSINPSITLTVPEEFVVKKTGFNTFKVKVIGTNFTSTSKCTIEVSDDTLLRVRPLKFLLNKSRNTKTLLARVPTLAAKDLINNEASDIVTVDVSCTNDASDSQDISITSGK